MHRSTPFAALFALLAGFACADAQAAGKLSVIDAWIRSGPTDTAMLAGYATLKNEGDAPISILTVQSDTFRSATLHETVIADDVAKMRELHRLDLDPGETVVLKPGAKHLMLMQPRHEIAVGDRVEMLFLMRDGQRVETYFEVVAAPASGD